MKKIYFDQEWGMFIGSFDNNKFHQHYALQLSISINEKIRFTDSKENELLANCILVRSNIIHQLECSSNQLLFLFNPASVIGHFLQFQNTENISVFDHQIISKIRNSAIEFLTEKLNFEQFIISVKSHFTVFDCECKDEAHFSDERIAIALDYLFQNSERVVSLEEIANFTHLSPSRFLHLFKEVTNITYRRAQLWNKIQQSLPQLNTQSITETAYEFGFADAAHYCRIFKQNFGFTPKLISKI